MTSQIVDPLGPLGLTAKYTKALQGGKLAGIRLVFTPTGVQVEGCLPSDPAAWVPLTEAMASKASDDARPFADEHAHIVSKYESRLDEECPTGLRSAADKAAETAAIVALPFAKRRALQMSNREFEEAFLRWVGGAPVARTAEQAEALRQERIAARGRGRGRGRGGRGRGSFRAPPQEAAQGPQAQTVGQRPT
jgi:hypothetical protein